MFEIYGVLKKTWLENPKLLLLSERVSPGESGPVLDNQPNAPM
jgi:hypothetical protein